jgi:hypothetical protein
MMIKTKKSYETPKPAFKRGTKVYFEGNSYKVIASTHTHTQLEGLAKAVANWQLTTCW